MFLITLSLLLTVGTLNLVDAQKQCVTPDRKPGSCILLDQCSALYNLIKSQQYTSSQATFLRQSQCGQYKGKVLICCSKQQPQMSGGSYSTSSQQNSRNDLLPKPGVCGKGADDKIFGGTKTKIDEFPWMALLQYANGGRNEGFHCGGSLINNRYVITAAHCIKGSAIPPNWTVSKVRLGEWDTNTAQDCITERGDKYCSETPIDVTIESFKVHEEYNPKISSQYNDIALLRLSRTIKYTDFISPICLPVGSKLRNNAFTGFSFDVSGWGLTEKGGKSNIKLKASVDTVDIRTCDSIYKQNQVALRDSQICAGGEKGVDSCNGDSGGPLVGVDNTNRMRPNYFLAGIVSFGTKSCGLQGWPGVYTRVGSYIDWIQRNISP